ncbi:class I SAM-dependent methyltransferase [Aliarcobacter butzleri]|uniref:class I SAM-dependent methyltransferase n=1 Tax=Aliarcobacter butzleri TaxID=28197 RepID=UPI001EDD7699|nr:class I SAM-dependent methyltransferase [Aliarcobacter butzleri]MCG3696192.1 class I SAM-dependent methyltransferase [Aliarcobacter butzleri]MCG3698310.1 class I SAM-dependent methyltransferase [Aliarcobacter butzleri]MDN5079263.1 class I SAM-dependent methyltransferase [Aliarcobacter butzleri]MDN5090529.1 class I SAM-dependent methyltransferase [Aliarcobacter butzleri]
MQNINNYLSLLLAQQKTEILELALELKIFKLIEENINTIFIISSKININEHKTKILLDSLVFMELLDINQDKYLNTKFAKESFIYGASSYCGDVFLHRKQLAENGKKMMKSMFEEKKELEEIKIAKLWADASKKFLKQEQKNLIAPMAVDIIKNLKEFSSLNKMLDLGCSSGVIGLEITKNHPNIKTTLFDYEEVTNITKEHINEYNLQNRVFVLNGDIEKNDIGKNYDLIWCSNIFYFFKDKKEVIKKIYDALNPNGILVSCHVEIDTKNSLDENSFFYFLSLNLQGKNILKPMELSDIFEEVGFKSINSYTTYKTPMTPSQIHICKK